MKEKKTAEELIEMLEKMENGERWKFLNELYHRYYNPSEKKTDIEY